VASWAAGLAGDWAAAWVVGWAVAAVVAAAAGRAARAVAAVAAAAWPLLQNNDASKAVRRFHLPMLAQAHLLSS
jgi:hypothetical protein